MPRPTSGLGLRRDAFRDIEDATSREPVPAPALAQPAETEAERERREQSIEQQLLAKSVSILEERLTRVEDSVIFKFNRRVGGFFKTRARKIAHFLRKTPVLRARIAKKASNHYAGWIRRSEARFESAEAHRMRSRGWSFQPVLSVVVATRQPNRAWLEETVRSIQVQSYERWQLCVCDDASSEPWVREYLSALSESDPNIHVNLSAEHKGIAASLNIAAAMAEGDGCVFLRQDDALHPLALHYIADALRNPDVDIVYADFDHLDADGRRVRPRFNPDWSPNLLLADFYWGHVFAVRRDSLQRQLESGELFRPEYEGAHEYDLALRLTDGPAQISHLPHVLLHSRAVSEGAARENAARALQDALDRRGESAKVVTNSGSFSIRRELSEPPLVSVIVCSRNARAFGTFVRGLVKGTEYDRMELVLVEHQTEEGAFDLDRIRAIWKRPFVHTAFAGAFNFSAMCNLGAKASNGSVLAFLNDDVQPLHRDWLERMVAQAQRPEVGIAGARLLYQSGAIQHAGIALGIADIAGHPGRGYFGSEFFRWLETTRDVAAVTGACMVMRADVFQSLNGFDAELAVNYNDVDLCLRAREHGYRIVYEGDAILRHQEAATRKAFVYHRERSIFVRRWHAQLDRPDPYFPAVFDSRSEDVRLS